MFDNIGGKIKTVAQVITWLGIIVSIIAFFVLSTFDNAIGLAFVVLIVGCLASWLSSLTLYGFGQLIQNTDILVKTNTTNANISIQETTKTTDKKEEPIKTAQNYVSPLHKILVESKLSEEKIHAVLALKQENDKGSISNSACRKQVYKIIEDLSIDKVLKIMNNL